MFITWVMFSALICFISGWRRSGIC
jgi:hypothetical protein